MRGEDGVEGTGKTDGVKPNADDDEEEDNDEEEDDEEDEAEEEEACRDDK
jgi:hypothetical protein